MRISLVKRSKTVRMSCTMSRVIRSLVYALWLFEKNVRAMLKTVSSTAVEIISSITVNPFSEFCLIVPSLGLGRARADHLDLHLDRAPRLIPVLNVDDRHLQGPHQIDV